MEPPAESTHVLEESAPFEPMDSAPFEPMDSLLADVFYDCHLHGGLDDLEPIIRSVLGECYARGGPVTVFDLTAGAFRYVPTSTWDAAAGYRGRCANETQVRLASKTRGEGHPEFAFGALDPREMDDRALEADLWIARSPFASWPCADIVRFMARAWDRRLFRAFVCETVPSQECPWSEPGGRGSRPLDATMAPLRYLMDDQRASPWGTAIQLAYGRGVRAKLSERWPTLLRSQRIDADPFLHHHLLLPSRPTVLLAVIVKDARQVLPTYLEHLDRIDYPKKSIILWVRTNNNRDGTDEMLRAWVDARGTEYRTVFFRSDDVEGFAPPEQQHDWNAERFEVLGRIRQDSILAAIEHRVDWYATFDADNFVHPAWLGSAIASGLPVISPLLRKAEDLAHRYSNFHAAIDEMGYYKESPAEYDPLIDGRVRGLVRVPVVHCSYAIRRDVLPRASYLADGSKRHEYVLFSESLRRAGIPQYLDCRRDWGLLTFQTDAEDVPKFEWVAKLWARGVEIPEW